MWAGAWMNLLTGTEIGFVVNFLLYLLLYYSMREFVALKTIMFILFEVTMINFLLFNEGMEV